jgi:two-component system sensor histidine kinase DesK
VRRLAAEALRDTRAVVLGYRRTTLDEEIANATKVLAAAGIDARAAAVDTTGGPPEPDAARHLLGLVMREATTNVLRHSRARHAEVEYRLDDGHARLRVSNDGADEPPPAPGPSGTGLAGLAERLGGAGGDLTWEHQGGRFVLTATLPVAGPVAQEQVAQEKQAR